MRRLLLVLPLLLTFLAPRPVLPQSDLPEVVRRLLETGERHRQAGRFDEAVASFEEALDFDPGAVAAYLSLGALHNALGENEKALETFARGLEHAPNDSGLLFNAAVLAFNLDRAEEARGYVERAIAADRRQATFHALHGAVLERLGEPDEALAALETAVKLDASPQNYFRLGNLLHALSRDVDAVEAYKKAIKKDRSYLRAHYNLGAVLFEVGLFDDALEAYRVALEPIERAFAAGDEVDPVHAQAFANLGAIYYQKGDWDDALRAYEKALRLDPAQPAALFNEGFIHYQQSRFDAAYEAYRKALELDPELALAYLHLGQISKRRGETAEAVRWLEQGMPRFDTEARCQALVTLGDLRLALGQKDEAQDAFRQVLADRPDELEALVALGRLLAGEGDLDGARELLERARRQAPEDDAGLLELTAVRLDLARAHLAAGEHAVGRRLFEEVQGSLPKLPGNALDQRQVHRLAVTHGLLLAAEGATKKARLELGDAFETDSSYVPVRDALQLLDVLDGGDPAVAAEALDWTHEVYPAGVDRGLAGANLGLLFWLSGETGAARARLEEALVTAGEAEPGAAAWWRTALGEIALETGDWTTAVDRLTEAEKDCSARPARTGETGGVLRVTIGGEASEGDLCARIRAGLGRALTAAAFTELERAGGDGEARRTARRLSERALGLPLGDVERPVALLVRGTVRLLDGDAAGARGDLAASAGGLPQRLVALARNNLGVALYHLGDVEAARREIEAARKAGELAASLNLGILLDDHGDDDHGDDAAQALELYEDYLARGGSRRADASSWVERLGRIYR